MIDADNNFSINTTEYSVSDISLAIKRTVESNFELVRIKGEVGRISKPASGHIYLDLKDDKAVISGVIWKGTAQRLQILPEEGLEIVVIGRISTFQGQSKYQIIIEKLQRGGLGALMALLEKRKKALFAEGIFDHKIKKKIPFLPKKIGVITSESGAVIQDIVHRVSHRFPMEIILWPVAVQGAKSASQIADAINGFNKMKRSITDKTPDVIIIARGGGSIEDLWSFNEEVVVRAVHKSNIPIISAVGHETDNTLVDLVADLRAPTPTAAAELAVPVRNDLISALNDLDMRRLKAEKNIIRMLDGLLGETVKRLKKGSRLLDFSRQNLDEVAHRLSRSLQLLRSYKVLRFKSTGVEKLNIKILQQSFSAKKEKLYNNSLRMHQHINREQKKQLEYLNNLSRILNNLSYRNTLKRGYSLVLDRQGGLVNSKEKASSLKELTIEFIDGKLDVKSE